MSPLYDAADFPVFVARARVCAELVTAIAADVNAASAACGGGGDDARVMLELKRTALGMLSLFGLNLCVCNLCKGALMATCNCLYSLE